MVFGMTFNDYHMGITAENIAEKWGITREELDEFSVRSQNKAEAAIKAGKFKDEIVPVEVPQRKGDPIIFDKMNTPSSAALWRKLQNSDLHSRRTELLQQQTHQESTMQVQQ